MAANPPAGPPQIYPRLAYRDVEAAIAFLEAAFGFRERRAARFTAEGGALVLTEMELGSGLLMLGREGNHGLSSPASLEGSTQMAIVYVDDVDAHHERAVRAGATVVMPLADQPWGDRRYGALGVTSTSTSLNAGVRDAASMWRGTRTLASG